MCLYSIFRFPEILGAFWWLISTWRGLIIAALAALSYLIIQWTYEAGWNVALISAIVTAYGALVMGLAAYFVSSSRTR